MHPIRLSNDRAAELQRIIDLGCARVDLVRVKIADTSRKFLRLEQLSEFISQDLPDDVAVDIATTAVQLRRTAYRLHIPVGEVFDAITQGLRDRDWDQRNIDKWLEVSSSLEKIATDPKIELVVKTSDLYYKHHFHLHDARVITDLRPVLSDGRTEIEAMILKNTLYIEYSNGNEDEKGLEIVLELDEIHKLRDELDKAIAKTDTIKLFNESRVGVPVIVYDSEW